MTQEACPRCAGINGRHTLKCLNDAIEAAVHRAARRRQALPEEIAEYARRAR